jgi:uncharacterized delta-60 repeat protein
MRRFIVLIILTLSILSVFSVTSAVQLGNGFGLNGIVTIPVGGIEPGTLKLARQSDGKLIVSYSREVLYFSPITREYHKVVLRLNTDGTLDRTFGTKGYAPTWFGGQPLSTFYDMAVDSSDRIVFTATMGGAVAIIRMLPNGTPDSGYGNQGIATFDALNGSMPATVLINPAEPDVVYAAGSRRDQNDLFGRIYKVTGAGTLDTSFDTDGILDLVIPGYEPNVAVTDLALDAAGRLIAVGFNSSSDLAMVARLSTAGVLDTAFDGDGLTTFPYSSFITEPPLTVVSDAGSNLYVTNETYASPTANNILVAKITSAGVPDLTFSEDGFASEDFDGQTEKPRKIVLDSSGKPLVFGSVGTSSSADTEYGLMRYNTDGTLDSSFGDAGRFALDIFGFNDSAQDIISDGAGGYYIAGFSADSTSDPNTTPLVIAIAKIAPDSGTGGGIDRIVYTDNPSFENYAVSQAKPASWTGNLLSKDKRLCNNMTYGSTVIYGYAGACAFVFTGSAVEKAKLTQFVSSFGRPPLLAGDTLGYSFAIQATGTVKLKYMVTLTYTNGTKAKIISSVVKLPYKKYTRLAADGFVVPQDVAGIMITVANLSASGKQIIDSAMLWSTPPFFGGARAALPLPDAPLLPLPASH